MWVRIRTRFPLLMWVRISPLIPLLMWVRIGKTYIFKRKRNFPVRKIFSHSFIQRSTANLLNKFLIRQKIPSRTFIKNPTFFKPNYIPAFFHSIKVMSNMNYCISSAIQFLQYFVNSLARRRIQHGSCFIKNQNIRFYGKHTGKSKLLGLPQ